jgi:hypothetical protein
MKILDWAIKLIHQNQWKKIEPWFFAFEDIQTPFTSFVLIQTQLRTSNAH